MSALEVDVAVVGGGLTGVAAAHYLAERRVRVALLERGALGGGATGRSAGLVLTGIADHLNRLARGVGLAEAAAVWRFSVENRRLVSDLVARHRLECGHEVRGSYALATFAAEAEDLRESIEQIGEAKIDCAATLIEGPALAREPLAPGGLAAIRYAADAAVDAAAFARGLAAALPAGLAEVRENAAVRAVAVTPDGVRIDTSAGEVRAEIAIIAANAYAPAIHPFFEGLIWPVRGQGFVTAPLRPLLACPVSASYGHEMYRQLPDGRLVAAGFNPTPREADLGTDDRPTEIFQGFLARFCAERVPGFDRGAPVERRFAGTAGFSRDALPLVGPLPGQPKLLAACGFTMRGLSFAVAAGRAVALLAAEGRREAPACFSPARFL